MQSQEKFSLLRSILRTLGLSNEAIDDIVGRIVDFLSELVENQPINLNFHIVYVMIFSHLLNKVFIWC